MEKIISKKGLMGVVAKKYVNNEKEATRFIKECREQTHNESTKKYWGEKLIKEIELFCDESI